MWSGIKPALARNGLIIKFNQFDEINIAPENNDEIKSITFTAELPQLTMKTNGFAAGNVKKGYFKTSEGEIVKLIVDIENKPFILITKIRAKEFIILQVINRIG